MIRVLTFIDWHSQIRRHNPRNAGPPVSVAANTLKKASHEIGKALRRLDEGEKYSVSLRLYYGWHKGYTQSDYHKAAITACSEIDFAALSRFPNITFSQNVEYGCNLIKALTVRINPAVRAHLANSYRQQERRGRRQEKMVDTALAADIVSWSVENIFDWALVVSEDDDLVPPIFTAEALAKGRGGVIKLLRERTSERRYLNLDQILVESYR